MTQDAYQVKVLPFERVYPCAEGETLLAAAQRHGYFLRYGCKNGGCGTCKSRLVDGDVDQPGAPMALSTADDAEGWILPCISAAADDCVIDVGAMELTEEEFLAGDQVTEFLAEVEVNERVARDVRRLAVRLIAPVSMQFKAGQFVNLEAPGTTQVRAYSMANPPNEDGILEFYVRVLADGVFSQCLETTLTVGDRLRLYGPFGQLRLRLSHRPVLMVCGGTGLAPLLAMVSDLARCGSDRPVHLYFGVRREDDLFGLDAIRAVQQRAALSFTAALSEGEWGGETGMITDLVARRHDSLRDWDAYLCGPPAMINAAIPMLVDRGVRKRNIYLDAFVPTGAA